jgi:predicted HTH transcriptional regulator
MTYVSTQFGVPIKRPEGNVIPGPFKAARISPEMEARIGEIMKAAVLKEGHEGKLPPDLRPVFDPSHYVKTSLTYFAKKGRVSTGELMARLKISEDKAKTVLTHMRTEGLIEYVSGAVKKWELA